MTTRQPLQALPPPSANVINTRYAHLQRPTSTRSANGSAAMDEQRYAQEDVQDAASVGSALSDLENDAEDEFEKRMIQNARDERRLSQALGGKPQAFRKARTHPRVGLTLDNLERNNAVAGADGHVKFESPPSSTGSARSDPAIHAPATWGRKSRSNRNWMRTITYEEEQQQTPAPADDTIHDHYDEAHANVPRRSVEDSPLSHKGTPRNDQSQEWDLTFELNEASMIASTPYIPRNTVLDDIRQRENESVQEQAATARLERMRQGSPEQSRPRTSSIRTVDTVDSSARITEQVTQPAPSPKRRLRTRTHSWQSIGKAQPVTGIGMEDPPVAMYKSAENIAAVDREVVATAQPVPPRRIPNRREDSQDLLRRLARVSNTPSPRQAAPSRPESAPPAPLDSAPQTALTETTQSESKPASVEETSVSAEAPDAAAATSTVRQEHTESKEAAASTEHVEATPMPKERPALNPKTPVVTGAWVDTPGPRTVQRPAVTSRLRSLSPKKGSPRKQKPSEKAEEPSEAIPIEPVRPQLPKSALQALVDEAKSQGRRPSADFGDSTINSLEDLIAPSGESQIDEDTLQGLQLPTETPRNEAERQRQQELLHLHRMNDRLRAARTSIRDASRGMKRVEDQVEHVEEGENGEKVKVVSRACPCAIDDHVKNFSMLRWWKSLFWEQRLKTLRQTSNSWGRVWGGLTGLSIFMIVLFTWWISEEIACVNMKAPKFPFVIPTLIYRTFVQGWWVPISSFFSWIAATIWSLFFGFEEAQAVRYSASQTIRAGSTMKESHWISDEAAKLMEEKGWDHSMFEDEILPGGR
ncbi:hypothetical protein J4E93_000098 [Alternaria ventricosa]|uniref:uncharacterized protein n=1 Tax=Alternaria ventricosa TaxID=1187951 RepID=UPI0020C32914|nr:uncharacterized protein J4E93_000098 [Alternaria ventricosa]KAI4655386.1 hypothetical protein J4E93_000098 [Alternaria ventricosa]